MSPFSSVMGKGVPVEVDAVVDATSMGVSMPPSSRFSFPPALLGRGVLRSLPALAERKSTGVAETSRESVLERGFLFWNEAAFEGGALVTAVVFFLSGFSGAGHSTSWERSIRSAVTHSKQCERLIVKIRMSEEIYRLNVC